MVSVPDPPLSTSALRWYLNLLNHGEVSSPSGLTVQQRRQWTRLICDMARSDGFAVRGQDPVYTGISVTAIASGVYDEIATVELLRPDGSSHTRYSRLASWTVLRTRRRVAAQIRQARAASYPPTQKR